MASPPGSRGGRVKLCIADPPYLGRGKYYGGRGSFTGFKTDGTMSKAADTHPEASEWDIPERHVQLVRDLEDKYDGWAIAMSRDSLPVYLSAAPTAHVAVWHNPAAWPPGGRIHATWEPVLVRTTPRKLAVVDRPPMASMSQAERAMVFDIRPKDVLVAVPLRSAGFIGAKPPAWTRWVLDMLGYNPEEDTVEDLFPGSGAVSAEIAQGVLL